MASAFANLCRDLFGSRLFIKGKLVIDPKSNVYAHHITSNSIATKTVYTDKLSEKVLNHGIQICGNIIGNIVIDGGVSVRGNLNLFNNLDMHCGNIENVLNLHVNKLIPKYNAIIWGNDDTQINTTPSPDNINNIAIGISAKSGFNSVSLGFGPYSYGNSVAIGSQTCMATVDSATLGKYTISHHEGVAVGYKNIAWGNSIAIGTHAYAGNLFSDVYQKLTNNSIAVGSHVVSDNTGIAIGHYSQAYQGYGHIAIGKDSNAGIQYKGANFGVAIGGFASAEGNKDVAIGYKAFSSVVYGNNIVSIGTQSMCNGNGAVSIGAYSICNSVGSVAIGTKTYTSHNYDYGQSYYSVAIGAASYIYNCPKSISIGCGATCYASSGNYYFQENKGNSIAIGSSAFSHALNSISIGHFANSSANFSITIGDRSKTEPYNIGSIVVGTYAKIGTNLPNVSYGFSIALGTYASVGNVNLSDIAIGHGATIADSDAFCTALGPYCVVAGNTSSSTAVGHLCKINETSSFSVAIGFNATVFANSIASIALGSYAAVYTNVNASTALGYLCTIDNHSSYSIAIGYNTRVFGNSSSCVAMGSYSFVGTDTNASTAIGYRCKVQNESSYSLALGYDSRVYGNSHGCMAIGYTSVYANVHASTAIGYYSASVSNRSVALGYNVFANADDGFFVHHRTAGPSIYNAYWIGDELVEVAGPSSIRFKEDVTDLEDIDDKFSQLRPVRYKLKEPFASTNNSHIGLIAEEVNALFPEFVIYGPENRVDGLHFDRMVTLAIKEIQSLKTQIKELKNENEEIKLRLNNLESKIN